jgi:hypothetical protein
MRATAFVLGIVLIVLIGFSSAYGQAATSKTIPPGAKVFLAAMPDGFDEYLRAAIEKKKVPLQVLADKDKADFQITGQSETQKASTAKKVIMWDWHSNQQASIQVSNLTSGEGSVRLFREQGEFGAWQKEQCRSLRQAFEREDRE